MSTPETPAEPPPPPGTDAQFRALAAVVVLLGVLAMATVMRFLAPVIVAAWFAGLTAELRARLLPGIGGRHRVAAVVTAALVVVVVAPMVLLAVPVVSIGVRFARGLSRGNLGDVAARLTSMTPGSGAAAGRATPAATGLVRRAMESAESLVGSATSIMSGTFATLSMAAAQLFLLAVCAYYFSAEGARMLAVVERASPLAPGHFHRLRDEFMSVARAMLVGELVTAGVQGIVAGVIYFALGIPGALLLTMITAVVALIPTVGTALVWVPVTVALALTGRVRDAVILGVLGVTVVATVDNVLRPYFSRLGAGKLHPLLLFLGIFGGLEAFGGWGIILGPLTVALFVAAFELYANELALHRPRLAP